MKRVGMEEQFSAALPIKQASFPAPFVSGLEYSAPARGTWNIVHVGMLIPKAHQIFVCAQGCLRGVVLTAAEMNAADRFSTIAIRQNNVLEGDMEQLIIDGVSDIIEKLPEQPPAILIYTSCIHHFMGCDLPLVYRELRERWPNIRFTDCYMHPTMRKSGLNPDQTMRRQLYSLLDVADEKENRSVHLAGNDFPLSAANELYQMLVQNSWTVHEIASCSSFEDYLALAKSSICLTTQPSANAAGKLLEEKYGQRHYYFSSSFRMEEIKHNLCSLADALNIPHPDTAAAESECKALLQETRALLGDTPIVIDYTAVPRPLSLCRLLLDEGFAVTTLYADSFPAEEKEDYLYLQQNAPELMIYPTVHTQMRVEKREHNRKTLAIGQKAAYFADTEHFVNIVEGGGLLGFDGIRQLCLLMQEAYKEKKDMRTLIQIKGMGCGCCQ